MSETCPETCQEICQKLSAISAAVVLRFLRRLRELKVACDAIHAIPSEGVASNDNKTFQMIALLQITDCFRWPQIQIRPQMAKTRRTRRTAVRK